MAVRISRRKIAGYFAEELIAGNKDIVKQLAAFLVETKRTRELAIIIRDIEYNLMKRGVVVANVTSAYELSQAATRQIKDLLSINHPKSSLHLRQSVDPALIGGVLVETPGHVIDMSVRRKLALLRANKI